jgi:peptidoglycan/xylan/chitin deacetylase (PgdA/CDA1 family)
MSRVKSIIKYSAKEMTGFVCRFTGLLYLVKRIHRKSGSLIVLNYHSFSNYNNYKIKRGSVLEKGHQRQFEKQVKWLNRHFGFTTPEDFFSADTNSKSKVFITFDDGYRDNFGLALPVLKKYHASAAFFIVTSIPGTTKWLLHDEIRYLAQEGKLNAQETEKVLKNLNSGNSIDTELLGNVTSLRNKLPEVRLMMDWEEIKTLHSQGFIIGSHTHNHSPFLFLNEAERRKELKDSLEMLSSQLKEKTTHFAYPNGLYDENCNVLMQESGIRFAFTTVPGFNRKTDSPLEIKRIGINVSDSLGVLLLKLLFNAQK